ncbi:MAG TPA: hypothetical protein VLF40_00265 [Candidatus Saccharimonadales bacterium]|nr:hypothetical protein [Candidatus Saccharimonadales bacterium]
MNRIEFQRTAGFALYTEVNDRLLDYLADRDIPALRPDGMKDYLTTYRIEDTLVPNPAGVSLALAMRHITADVPVADQNFYRDFGVSQEDQGRACYHTFGGGFSDMVFTWHFSAGVANAVMDFFVDEGVLSQEQKNAFGLGDWADIIGSDWFGRLMHMTALTANGAYLSFGTYLSAYRKHAFAHALKERFDTELEDNKLPPLTNDIFTYHEHQDPADGRTYAAAGLAPAVLGVLRTAMQDGHKSAGCPVARKSVLLPADQVQDDPHTKQLVADGTLTAVPERSTDEHIRFTQETTAIDRTLQLFASQLRRYEAAHGTPEAVKHLDATAKRGATYRIAHRHKPPVRALSWETGGSPRQTRAALAGGLGSAALAEMVPAAAA